MGRERKWIEVIDSPIAAIEGRGSTKDTARHRAAKSAIAAYTNRKNGTLDQAVNKFIRRYCGKEAASFAGPTTKTAGTIEDEPANTAGYGRFTSLTGLRQVHDIHQAFVIEVDIIK